MDPTEIQRRWMDREPVEGVAFVLNDSVTIASGPNAGSRGAVVSLVTATPEPQYVVELGDGSDMQLPQSALLTGTAEDPGAALGELQRWYSSQCDGDWEHQLGIQIETLDNPGWLVKINIAGTLLTAAPFPSIREIEDEREWMDCKVENDVFQGAGGPHMLGAIIEVFMRWVRDAGERTE